MLMARTGSGKRPSSVSRGQAAAVLEQQAGSGGERTRTADFHVANVALYQLSYTPGVVSRLLDGRAVRAELAFDGCLEAGLEDRGREVAAGAFQHCP
jgi:hypothetical protein